MTSPRVWLGSTVTALFMLLSWLPAVQASAAPASYSPCVHRGITFFCGRVPTPGAGPAVTTLQFSFGDPTDLPLFGDWNGDGDRTAAVFRPATATWYLTNTDQASDAPQVVPYGNRGDIPLSGDWSGAGAETIGVYRPSNATFYLRYANSSGTADVTIPFGNRGDIPLAGDFDLTGTTRIGVYRPANQTFYLTHAPSFPSGPVTSIVYGNPGDRPLAGMYMCSAAGSQMEKIYAVFRPSNITWYGLCSETAMSTFNVDFQYGNPTDLPLLK